MLCKHSFKHISKSKTFQKEKPNSHSLSRFVLCLFETVRWRVGEALHKYDTLLLAISKWIVFKCFRRHACDACAWTLFFWFCLSVFHAVDGTMVVFDLLQKGNASAYTKYTVLLSRLICACVHITSRQGNGGDKETTTTKKNCLVENRNALATCCAIEFVCCVCCGWCVNSRWLQKFK